MTELIQFLEQIALFVIAGLCTLQAYILKRQHELDKRTAKMESRPDGTIPLLDRMESRLESCEDRLDRGTTKIDELVKDVQALRADVARVLGILERK